MIVLKSSQDAVLSLLQSVAGIVERRHTLPILANVLVRKTDSNPAAPQASASSAYLSTGLKLVRNRAMSVLPRCTGFFSSSKTNLRNAP
jgi:hypothetical protein